MDPLAARRRGRGGASARASAARSGRRRPVGSPSRACRRRSRGPTARRAGPASGTGSGATAGRASRRPRCRRGAGRSSPTSRTAGSTIRSSPLAADEQQARLGPDPPEPEVAAERAGAPRPSPARASSRRGLERGREADHRQRQTGAGDLAGGLDRARPVPAGTSAGIASTRGFGDDPDRRLGEDRRTGPPSRGRARGGPDRRPTPGCGGSSIVPAGASSAPAGEERLDPAEPDRLLARPTGRRPSRRASSAPTTAGSGRGSGRAGASAASRSGPSVPAPNVARPLRSSRSRSPASALQSRP